MIARLKPLKEKCDAVILSGVDVEYFLGVPRETMPYLVWDFSGKPRVYAWDVNQARAYYSRVSSLEKMGLDFDTICARKPLDSRIKKLARGKRVVDISKDIDLMRAVKTKEELRIMRKAARLAEKGFELVQEILEPGVTEKEIAANICSLFTLEGDGCSFEPIVASGKNSVYIHVLPTSRKIRKGDMVIVDIGARVKGYQSDFTRTFLVEPKKRQLEIVERVLDAWELVKESVSPGMKFSELDRLARGSLGKFAKFWPYSLGHGVGLEVHEFPRISQKSKGEFVEGMVFTLEPGLHVPGVGGARFEDTGVLTRSGFKPLAEF